METARLIDALSLPELSGLSRPRVFSGLYPVFDVLYVPLRARGRVLGCLALIRTSADAHYDRADESYCRQLATTTALALDAAEAQGLRARNEALETFAGRTSRVAHDFNNLLTGVMGHCELALRELGERHLASSHLHEIEQAANRAASLTRHLLARSDRAPRDLEADTLPPPPFDEPEPARPLTVLIIDDEPLTRMLAREVLDRHGFETIVAADGHAGAEALAKHGREIDLVVLDIPLPEQGGRDALFGLRRIAPDVPVVIVSGYDVKYAAKRLEGLGVAAYLQKPFRIEALITTIRCSMREERANMAC